MSAENSASPVKVYTAGATREGLDACKPAFEESTGLRIEWTTDHGHIIREKVIEGGVDADVVLLPQHMIEDLAHRDLLASVSPAELGAIRIGAAVREGDEVPDVSTMDAMTEAMLAAPALLLTEAPSGVHIDSVIDRLGLRMRLEDKIRRFDKGTQVNEALVSGELPGALAFGVATEILFFRDRGVVYAGPVPEEIQMKHTYCAAMLADAARPDAAERLLAELQTPAAIATFSRTGVEKE